MAGFPGVQNFAQPTSNPTYGQNVDNIPWNAHNFEFPPLPDFGFPEPPADSTFHFDNPPQPKNDGPSLQVGHYCRLPSGQMEWVHNPFLPQGAEFEEAVEMTTPLAQDSTSHVAKETGCSSRRTFLASVFKERMRILRENRARTPRIRSDPPQADLVASRLEDPSAINCSPLTATRPKNRLNQQPIQYIPVKPSDYQKRQSRVSKNTPKPRRQIRKTVLGVRMETVLEEEAESPAVAQPSNGLIPPVIEEDQNGPMQDNFMDNGFMDEGFMDEVFDHENAWPAKCAPSDPTCGKVD